jgi:hypothetical protein
MFKKTIAVGPDDFFPSEVKVELDETDARHLRNG